MALKVDYVVKETARNLIRNPLLSLATIVVVTVAVALVGGSLLIRQGVSNATERWQGDIEFIVYMNPDATQDQIDAVQRELDESPQVAESIYLDQEAAYEEAREILADSPELIEGVAPDAFPPNFKVRPVDPDPDVVRSLVDQFGDMAGVRQVVAATDAIRSIERISNILSTSMAAVALVLTSSALLFIGFTIQTAVFSRRHEIEVMKLVGATNWFIRVPFMLEGIVQGVIGGIFGVAGIYGLNYFLSNVVSGEDGLGLFSNFGLSGGALFSIAVLVFAAVIVLVAIGSAVAVSFYVDV
jgi:cell division transport system permease protein